MAASADQLRALRKKHGLGEFRKQAAKPPRKATKRSTGRTVATRMRRRQNRAGVQFMHGWFADSPLDDEQKARMERTQITV